MAYFITFIKLCAAGDLARAKKLLTRNKSTLCENMCESAFESACIHGHLDVARWLLIKFPNFIFQSNKIFLYVCHLNKPAVARWLLEQKSIAVNGVRTDLDIF